MDDSANESSPPQTSRPDSAYKSDYRFTFATPAPDLTLSLASESLYKPSIIERREPPDDTDGRGSSLAYIDSDYATRQDTAPTKRSASAQSALDSLMDPDLASSGRNSRVVAAPTYSSPLGSVVDCFPSLPSPAPLDGSRHAVSSQPAASPRSIDVAFPRLWSPGSPSSSRSSPALRTVNLPAVPPRSHSFDEQVSSHRIPRPRARSSASDMSSSTFASSDMDLDHAVFVSDARLEPVPLRVTSAELLVSAANSSPSNLAERRKANRPSLEPFTATRLAVATADFPAVPTPSSTGSTTPSPWSSTGEYPLSRRSLLPPPRTPTDLRVPGFVSLFLDERGVDPPMSGEKFGLPARHHGHLRRRSNNSKQWRDEVDHASAVSATSSLKELAMRAAQVEKRLQSQYSRPSSRDVLSEKPTKRESSRGRWWLKGTRVRPYDSNSFVDSMADHWSAFRKPKLEATSSSPRPLSPKSRTRQLLASRKGRIALTCLATLVVAAVVVAVVLSRRNGGEQTASERCVNIGGISIAQGVLDLASTANDMFTPQLALDRLPHVMATYLSFPPADGQSCRAQLARFDLPSLPAATFPKRRAWTQAAVLWSEAISESNTTLRRFASAVDFTAFGDEPSTLPNSNFQLIAAGYTFDLAQMTSYPPAVSWASRAQASATQQEIVSSVVSSALDRLSAYAVAGSRARSTALLHRWQELGLAADDLDTFRAAWRNAAVLLPFDALGTLPSGVSVSQRAQELSDSSSFPLGPGCLDGLGADQVDAVNTVEADVFGLPPITSLSSYNASSCLRPIYGELNLMNLRLPSNAQQAIRLSDDAKARCTLRVGATLSRFLDGPLSEIQQVSADQFGTFNNLDHLLLGYLNQLPPDHVRSLVSTIVTIQRSPSTTGNLPTDLADVLDSLPSIEVQLWGGLSLSAYRSSVSAVVSPIANEDGSLIFGSADATAFRTWAMNATGTIEWARSAKQVEAPVKEMTTSKKQFDRLWAGAAGLNISEVWDILVAG